MPTYSIKIYKGDHRGDLHLHFFYNTRHGRTPIGRYRIPSLEPLPGTDHNLTVQERIFIEETLGNEEFRRKLQDALESTMFNLHHIAERAIIHAKEGNIIRKEGKTFITISIPVVDRI